MNPTSMDPFASAADSGTHQAAPGGSAGPDPVRDDEASPPGPKMSLKTKLAAGALAVGLLATGGFALTQLGGSSAAASAASGAQGGPGGAGGGFRAAGGAGAPATGTISAVSPTSISVKTTSGTRTYKIASGTVVQNNAATATSASLTVGEKVVVFTGAGPGSTTTTSTGTASRILAGSSATPGPGAGGGPPANRSAAGAQLPTAAATT